MKINREKLLSQVESVQAGLSTREIIEQSSCVIFQDGYIKTFNDEIGCTAKTSLDVEGAVIATSLLSILRKLPDETLRIIATEEELLIRGGGKKRNAGIRLEQEIKLPVNLIEKPKGWKKLPIDFVDAVHLVERCAGTNESEFIMTCIYIHPKWIQACDNYQAARYRINTGVEEATLIRKESLKCIVDMNMTKFCLTKKWIHFKNPTGLVLSIRQYEEGVENYPKLTRILKVTGIPTTLPKGLKEAAEKARIFSIENVYGGLISLSLKRHELCLRGEGVHGWYSERIKTEYDSKPISFTIKPDLLIELVQRYDECEIDKKRLMIKVGKFKYVTALGTTDE